MNDMVTIPASEYQQLLSAQEDLADLMAVRAHLSNPQAGLPHEFAKRLIEGEAALKLWREHRGLGQNELSQASGVNRVQIGDIETRGKTGSVETLKKLAETLDISVDDLIT